MELQSLKELILFCRENGVSRLKMPDGTELEISELAIRSSEAKRFMAAAEQGPSETAETQVSLNSAQDLPFSPSDISRAGGETLLEEDLFFRADE